MDNALDDVFAPLPRAWILYRDEALIALDKPAGLSSASSDGADDLRTRLQRHLAAERNVDPDHIYVGVHEHLERDCSGVTLFTLDKRANPGLARQLEQQRVNRDFVLVTAGDHGPRKIEHTQLRAGALRRRLAGEGTPVIGDNVNGGPRAHRVMFHAAALKLEHPVTAAPLEIRSPTPDTLRTPAEHASRLRTDATYRAALLRDAASRRGTIRNSAIEDATDAMRWVHGESDGFAGLAIDVYGRWLVAHVFDEGWLALIDALSAELMAMTACAGVYVKQHPRQKNELASETISALAGEAPTLGDPAPDPLTIHEHGVPYLVRLGDGLRTGLFLDQRANRLRVRELAKGARVLNLFAYTCGFSIAALAGDAHHVTSVDASGLVMARAQPAIDRVGSAGRHRAIVGDCFDVLRDLADQRERFELLIVDPPSYASTTAGRFRLRHDYPRLVAATIAVAAPGARVLCCTNHHGTNARQLRALVSSGLDLAETRALQLRDVPPPEDFPPPPGGDPELKSLWVTLDSVLRPKRGRV